ncbi:hypothetical protein [Rubrivirga sp.]
MLEATQIQDGRTALCTLDQIETLARGVAAVSAADRLRDRDATRPMPGPR